MRGKMVRHLTNQNRGGSKLLYYLCTLLVLLGSSFTSPPVAEAVNCPELRVIFARGSGGVRNEDQNYLAFKSALESKLETTSLSYDFYDLDYPAIGIGDLSVLAGAFFGAGEAYEFGESVNAGVERLVKIVNSSVCTQTKYVLGGYSQGAMVVSKALNRLNADKVIYAATFGDPKIYLPEGEGLIPAACRGDNLSDYRAYVPDCQAYMGLLGAYIPYEPAAFVGKVGTWCNKRDVMCSSKFSISDHTAYVSDDLYEDAAKRIFTKITEHFGVPNTAFSPHDTAFLIDSTGTMEVMIDEYKDEIIRLAEETLEIGGRIALYEFKDLYYGGQPRERCNFETCTLEKFTVALLGLEPYYGGDPPESVLSASYHAMNQLNWQFGATKSIVVLTDNYYLNPDRDGIVLSDVVSLSKQIDPVNFYPIVPPFYKGYYRSLAEGTEGKISTSVEEFHEVVDLIMKRNDSLPRVDEGEATAKPELIVDGVERVSDGAVRITFESDCEQVIVVMNDAVLGVTSEKEITIDKLDSTISNAISLVPVSDGMKGEMVEAVRLEAAEREEMDDEIAEAEDGKGGVVINEAVEMVGPATNEKSEEATTVFFIPKAPNTGRR